MTPPPASHSPQKSGRELIQEFLAEINGLSIQLKRQRSGTGAALPFAARAVLELLVCQGSMPVPALARARGTSRQNVQSIVNRLKREGLVRLEENPAHKRSEVVCITEKGTAALQRSASEHERNLRDLLALVSPGELEASTQLIRRLRKLFGAKQPVRIPRSERAPVIHQQPQLPPPPSPNAGEDLPVSLL